MKWKYAFFGVAMIFLVLSFVAFAEAQSQRNSFSGRPNYNSYSSVVRGDPNIHTLYGKDVYTYWPRLEEPLTCEAREDIILQVSPAGCQPTVVRSDLLAEQNVVVFCEVDALKINPLIDISKIRNVRFKGDFPDEVVGVGFHPSKAALQSQSRLTGTPFLNNIGYVTVVLRQQPDERETPDFVNFTLSAQLDYQADGGIGTGRASFLLEETDDLEWEAERDKQSFWDGDYALRLEEVGAETATVSVYQGERKIRTVTVDRRRSSPEIYMPGFYCQAGVEIIYDGLVPKDITAKIQVDNDVFEVKEGSRFLNDKCYVQRIYESEDEGSGIDLRCGGENVKLELGKKNIQLGDEVVLISGDYAQFIEDFESGKIYKVVSVNEKENIYNVTREGESLTVPFEKIVPFSGSKLNELEYNASAEKFFDDAIADFGRVVDEYPEERPNQGLNFSGIDVNRPYGERALTEAIELAARYNKQFSEARLLELYLETYPSGGKSGEYTRRLADLYRLDTSLQGKVVDVDNQLRSIKLLSVEESDEQPAAVLTWGNDRNFELEKGDNKTLSNKDGDVTLRNIRDSESVDVNVICDSQRFSGRDQRGGTYTLRVGDSGVDVCGQVLVLNDVKAQNFAQIRLVPKVRGAETETNFTVGIGIEKRAIELNPYKANEKIKELNETIQKWETVSENLGQVVTGLKTACFATAGALTVKNFLTGLGGEGFARQRVMQDKWNAICDDRVSQGQYTSRDACFYANANEIDSDVTTVEQYMEEVDSITERNQVTLPGGGFLEGDVVDRNKTINNILSRDFATYNSCEYENGKTVGDVLNGASYDNGDYSYDQIRDIMLNCKLAQNSDPELSQLGKTNLRDIASTIQDNKEVSAQIAEIRNNQQAGLPAPASPLAGGTGNTIVAEVRKWSNVNTQEVISGGSIDSSSSVAIIPVTSGFINLPGGGKEEFDRTGSALVELEEPGTNGLQGIKKVYFRGINEEKYSLLSEDETATFKQVYKVGGVRAASSLSYTNTYQNPQVRYYETEPYKGIPAIVPFDVRNGWYAAVEQTLPVFGGMSGFDSSGRPVSFFVCNVGEDGREQFFENRARDICQLVNINTGQALDQFPGLSETQAKEVIRKAINALQEAQRQYGDGKNSIRINGEVIPRGTPAANVPATQCQNFMSPNECALLFNVCDPVICPASRCNFGGSYYVSDVVQSGIVGSALLCLPNFVGFGGDVAVPVCLTGIQAGVDSYLSILKSQQQCLAENIETGRYVGICDEITAVYMCEFFWRQAAPLADALIPKLLEVATGGGTRGGGEYLNVQNAWQNTQGSIDYFTNQYAVNSLDAFNIRSTQEIGGEVCQAFVSAKFPKTFETIVEPDSPPQFHAWFNSHRLTDVTLPATAQYKVFYHIFAGNEQGVQYLVYLKNPPESGFYSANPTVTVASGFIPQGDFATETADFTAPEGYQELCVSVNGKEECGFKQVSTSFAVNYVTDSFAASEIARKDITTQRECISGGLNPNALLNPNLENAAQEAIDPAVYNRGIVRVCASQNPGSATDPGRFVNVGYCGDESLICWLDKKSVDNAIDQRNIDVRNQTLEDLSDSEISALQEAGQLMTDEQVENIVRSLDAELKGNINSNNVAEFLQIIDLTLEKTIFNNQKAALITLRGLFNKDVALDLAGIPVVDANRPGSDDSIVESSEGTDGQNTQGNSEYLIARSEIRDGRIVDAFYLVDSNGIQSPLPFFIFANDVRLDTCSGSVDVGDVSGDRVVLDTDKIELIRIAPEDFLGEAPEGDGQDVCEEGEVSEVKLVDPEFIEFVNKLNFFNLLGINLEVSEELIQLNYVNGPVTNYQTIGRQVVCAGYESAFYLSEEDSVTMQREGVLLGEGSRSGNTRNVYLVGYFESDGFVISDREIFSIGFLNSISQKDKDIARFLEGKTFDQVKFGELFCPFN